MVNLAGSGAFKFDVSGDSQRFRRFLNPQNWTGNLEKNIRKATIRNALFLQKQVKNLINSDEYAENSELTLALKRSNKPLVDKTNLFKAIDTIIFNSFSGEVGILRNASSTGSKFGKRVSAVNLKDLVQLMEEGYVITVTKAMRRAIAATLAEDKTSKGKLKKKSRVALERLSESTGAGEQTYVVPPRPLLSKVFENPATERVLVQNWRVALEGAFLAQGALGGEHRDG